ncbi:alpha/beta fold hydrolase [Streptomyces sp. NPDC059708]|uniref:alpha/beta fold hydrolase n=1 Tax=Streptomyces sp. NPDC059708 TaxID=3346916 RepID=UPI0036CA52EC
MAREHGGARRRPARDRHARAGLQRAPSGGRLPRGGGRLLRRGTGRRGLGRRAGGASGRLAPPLRPGADGPVAGGRRPSLLLSEWERVECLTLLVLGQSGIIPAPEAGEMLLRRPATVAVSVPGAGHDLHLERPEALCDVVSDFLGGLSSSAGN